MNFDKIFGETGCVTSNNWVHFGADLNHDADTGIFKGILPWQYVSNAELDLG